MNQSGFHGSCHVKRCWKNLLVQVSCKFETEAASATQGADFTHTEVVLVFHALGIPSGKLTWLDGNPPCPIGNTATNGGFSIARLVYGNCFFCIMDVCR